MKTTVRVLAAFAMIYFIAYFLLMARNVPAVDKAGRVVFQSSYRMARTADPLGPLTIAASHVSFLNYLFYPMDKLYYRFAPANVSLNSIPSH